MTWSLCWWRLICSLPTYAAVSLNTLPHVPQEAIDVGAIGYSYLSKEEGEVLDCGSKMMSEMREVKGVVSKMQDLLTQTSCKVDKLKDIQQRQDVSQMEKHSFDEVVSTGVAEKMREREDLQGASGSIEVLRDT